MCQLSRKARLFARCCLPRDSRVFFYLVRLVSRKRVPVLLCAAPAKGFVHWARRTGPPVVLSMDRQRTSPPLLTCVLNLAGGAVRPDGCKRPDILGLGRAQGNRCPQSAGARYAFVGGGGGPSSIHPDNLEPGPILPACKVSMHLAPHQLV